MRKWIFISLISLTVWACGGSDNGSTTGTDTPSANLNTSDINGKALYMTTCVACHGANGKLGTNGSKDLTASALTLEERISILNNGVKGTAMIAYNSIYSPKEIQAIAEYTMELGK
jgi:cytochrome c6